MSHDKPEQQPLVEQPSTEEQTEKIQTIVGDEALGYEGSARGEHSGQATTPVDESMEDTLAKNRPEEMT